MSLICGPRIDMTGERFGRLVVLAYVDDPRPGGWWRCQCNCGTECVKPTAHLRRGATRSCACLPREVTADRNRRRRGTGITAAQREQLARLHRSNEIHGHGRKPGGTREHSTWLHMRGRCGVGGPRAKGDLNYVRRGMAEEWKPRVTGFIAFLDYVLATIGPHPGAGYKIDRIDNSCGYYPGNIRWAPATEQRAQGSRVRHSREVA